MTEADYPKVLAAAEQSGMTVTVLRRTGLPQLFRRYRARIGIPIGILAGALLLSVLTGKVWQVTVTGNVTIGTEEILDVMRELGVVRGSAIRELDLRDVARQAGTRLPKLSWIAVNLDGCKINVDVREITETPILTDERDYCNIVAARDGVIVQADVLEGAGQPLVGTAVVHGDLLVSGVIEMRHGYQRFVNAKALIRAQTKSELSAQLTVSFDAETPVCRRTVYRVIFFDAGIPLGWHSSGAETECVEYDLQSRTTVFPIGIAMERSAVYEPRSLTLPDGDAALVCFSDFCAQAFERYREAELLHREIVVTVENGTARTAAVSECIEDICERQPFAVDDAR